MWDIPLRIERLFRAIENRLGAIQQTINEQTNTSMREQTADREEIQSSVRTLRSISDNIQAGNQQAETSSNQANGQQQELIRLQGRLVFWAASAFWAAFGYGAVALWQGCQMHQTYTEMQNQTKAARQATYMACLSAQSAQATVFQIERGASDAHAAAAAAVQQAAADIETDRAIVSFLPRVEGHNERFGTTNFAVPYRIRNSGKSTASTVTGKFKAVFLGEGEVLHIDSRNFEPLELKDFDPGEEEPPKPETPELHQATAYITVRDSEGKAIPRLDYRAETFLNGGAGEIAVYGMLQYIDLYGTHTHQICRMLRLVPAGHSKSGNSATGETCDHYVRIIDSYRNMPQIQPVPALDVSNFGTISCPKPQDSAQ
jgi:hypothetical protein